MSDLITIKSINYNHHSLVIGLNNEFINLVYQIHSLFTNKNYLTYFNQPKYQNDILSGKINIENIDHLVKCKNINDYLKIINQDNHFSQLLNKYGLKQIDQINEIIEELKKILTINLNYSVWNNDLNNYETKTILIDFNQLFYQDYELLISLDLKNKYSFKIDSIEVNENKTNTVYLPYSKNNFKYSRVSNYIEPIDDEYYAIKEQKIAFVKFNEIKKDLLKDYPTNVPINSFLNDAVTLYDSNNQQIDNSLFLNSFKTSLNDLNGTINVEVEGINQTFVKDYTGFKKISDKQKEKIDVNNYQYGLIASKTTNEQINQILLNNGFSSDFINDSNIKKIANDDKRGIINFVLINQKYGIAKNIELYNFDQYYIEQKNDQNILNTYEPSKITNEIIMTYLLNLSPRFKNEHLNDLNITKKVNKANNTLNVKISFDNQTVEYIYQFNNKNNKSIINNICYCAVVLGVIGLLLIFAIEFIKNKKTKQ